MRNGSKYSSSFDEEYTMKLVMLFENSTESLTVSEMIAALGGELTAQKVVRLIGKVNEILPIIRQKGRDGLMHYKAKEIHRDQGYDVSFYTGPQNTAVVVEKQHSYFNPGPNGWVAPRYRCYYDDEGNEV